MEEAAVERPSFLTPARLVVGSLVGGAGIALLALFFGGSAAHAAEPAPPPPAHSLLSGVGSLVSGVDDTVSSVVGHVGTTLGAVTAPVATVVPAPVQNVVSTVTTPVTDVLHNVAAATPVSHIVTPVTSAVDSVLNAVPVTHQLLGDNPLGTIVNPVAATVDNTVGAVAGLTHDAVAPLGGQPAASGGGTGGPGSGEPGGGVIAGPPLVSPNDGTSSLSPGVATVMNAGAVLTVGGPAWSAVHPVPGTAAVTGSDPSGAPGAPFDPNGRGPLAQPATTGGGAAGPGSGAAGVGSALPSDIFALSTAASGAQGPSTDDRLPSSPVADNDSSPD
ncbi:hypothetical protein [Leifsonia poae]|uniref:hypothetical protein n=1 Tax=Leifsonia poae TaxID=110933 RepID=UPI001CBF5E78|nr:hypothetical protein [Leifsonia poae]